MKLGQRRPDLAYATKMGVLAGVSVPAFVLACHFGEAASAWYWVAAALGGLGGTIWSGIYFLFMGNDISDEIVRRRRCATCCDVPASRIQGSSIKLTCRCGTKYRPSAWRGAPSIGDY